MEKEQEKEEFDLKELEKLIANFNIFKTILKEFNNEVDKLEKELLRIEADQFEWTEGKIAIRKKGTFFIGIKNKYASIFFTVKDFKVVQINESINYDGEAKAFGYKYQINGTEYLEVKQYMKRKKLRTFFVKDYKRKKLWKSKKSKARGKRILYV